MIQKYLTQLGFSENETRVYLALIEVGMAGANELSRAASVNRTTTYSVLENLVARGLVTTDQEKGRTQYTAGNPSSLLRSVIHERDALDQKEQLTNQLVELIEPLFRSKDANVPRLRFYDGNKNVEAMLFDNLPEWEKSMIANDGILWGYQDHTFVEEYMPWLKHHWVRNKKFDLQVRLFSNESELEQGLRGKVALRTIRPFPLDFQFDSTIWICGDYIILLMTHEKPHYAFELKDARFAGSLRMIFGLLWSLKALR